MVPSIVALLCWSLFPLARGGCSARAGVVVKPGLTSTIPMFREKIQETGDCSISLG